MKNKIKSKSYKLWIAIEEHIIFSNGAELYKDVDLNKEGIAFSLSDELDTFDKALEVADKISQTIK